jgi:hypothetical protein
MRTSKNRSSLNTSTTTNDSSFRWQQCSQCPKSIPSTSDNHQCSDELNSVFVEHNRARLLVQEHKPGLLKEQKTKKILTTTFFTVDYFKGLLWPNSVLSDNQVAISRTMIDQLSEQQMIELRTIPKDLIRDTNNITLRYNELEEVGLIQIS